MRSSGSAFRISGVGLSFVAWCLFGHVGSWAEVPNPTPNLHNRNPELGFGVGLRSWASEFQSWASEFRVAGFPLAGWLGLGIVEYIIPSSGRYITIKCPATTEFAGPRISAASRAQLVVRAQLLVSSRLLPRGSIAFRGFIL